MEHRCEKHDTIFKNIYIWHVFGCTLILTLDLLDRISLGFFILLSLEHLLFVWLRRRRGLGLLRRRRSRGVPSDSWRASWSIGTRWTWRPGRRRWGWRGCCTRPRCWSREPWRRQEGNLLKEIRFLTRFPFSFLFSQSISQSVCTFSVLIAVCQQRRGIMLRRRERASSAPEVLLM